MKPNIYFHSYKMHSRKGLNSRSHHIEHEGALIRVEMEGVSGYGCLHPWVELGDSSLDELLKQLAEGRMSRQVRCALECAEVDRKARKAGVNLFEGLEVPMSHATIVGGVDRVELAVAAGFDTVKLKMGRDVASNIGLLREVHQTFEDLRIRLDYNGVSTSGAIEHILKESGEGLRRQIDFIEDPFLFENSSWVKLREKYGVKFAVDRGVSRVIGEYDVSIVKPAINDTEKICGAAQLAGRNVVVTSYMDHPLGQSYAAYCAGKLNGSYLGLVDKRCGLMTHGLYEATDFTERMGEVTPSWDTDGLDSNLGLGFGELLDELLWKKLL